MEMNRSTPAEAKRSMLAFTLLVLLGINTMNFFDRQVLGAVAEPIKEEWSLSDKDLGALGAAFTLLYGVVGVPFGRWADFGRRTKILAAGAAVWSLLTAACGLAWSFWSLFVIRLGVGVGEASCAPAANSLLGDMFPPQRRARALAVFMLGLPLGLGLSSLIGSAIAQRWGWKFALMLSGVPGLILALLTLWIPEPERGAEDRKGVGSARRPGSAVLLVLSSPTMWWLIVSGVLHNFNMYALGMFLSPFLQRYHHMSLAGAGRISSIVYGCGGLGVFLGGWACDRISRRRISGRLEVTALALLVFVPCLFLALSRPPEDYWGFTICFLPGCLLSYAYYSGVYATIQDITEPASRGTAMAVYFCAFYVLGAAPGPYLLGMLSDFLASRAARLEVITEPQAKAIGLHQALYVMPILGIALVIVLFIGSRTVKRDYEKLQKWMATQHTEG